MRKKISITIEENTLTRVAETAEKTGINISKSIDEMVINYLRLLEVIDYLDKSNKDYRCQLDFIMGFTQLMREQHL